MRLKAIEINGFKSFAEKTRLSFEQGITAIVGPNGSGKSNILDAILWALGEQSYKTLRANKGRDVIFSGGKEKSAKGMAQVSLFIDNSSKKLDIEYTNLKITRKIYSSGENEYLINNQIVRMKDIKKLFLDTGIGKSSYSVIGQGQVEEIVMSNSTSLRNIIDEAAEVKKNKMEKEEIKDKLKTNQDDLDKILYLENELAENLKPLEKQAKKTRRYNEFNNKLLNLKYDLYTYQINKYENKIKIIKEKEHKCKKEDDILKNKFNDYETKIEQKLDKNNEISMNKEKLEEKKENTQDNLNFIINQITLFTERLNNYEKEKSENKKDFNELDYEINNLKKTIQDLESELKNKKNNLTQEKEVIEKSNQEIQELENDLKKIELKIQDKKEEIFDNEIKKTKLQNKIENYKDRKKRTKTDNNELDTELDQILQKHNRVLREKERMEYQKQDMAKKISEEKTILSKLEEKLKKQENQKNNLETKLNEYKIKINNREMKLDNLKKLSKNYDGFFYGVKKVLKADIEGVIGPFLSIIDIPKKLETGIQAIVGNAMQNIVVENSSIAKKCVKFLKENRAGRATFLPLDTVKSYKKSSVDEAGVVGIAADLVGYDPKYEKVINNVLGSILIVEDMDAGLKISKSNLYSGNIVTLDGDIIYGSGKITGGQKSKSKTSAIFQRKRDQEKISRELKELKIQRDDLSKEYKKLDKEYQDDQNLFQTKKSSLYKSVNEFEQLKSDLVDIKYKLEKLIKEKKVILFEKDEQDRQNKESSEKIDKLKSELENIKKISKDLNKNIQNLKENYEEQKNNLEIKRKQHSEEKINIIEKREKLNSKRSKLKELRDNLEMKNIKIKEYKNKKQKLSMKIEELNNKLIKLKKNEKTLQEKEKDLKKNIEKYQKEIKELESQEKKYILKLKEVEKKMISKENELSKIRNDKTKLEMELKSKKGELENLKKEIKSKDVKLSKDTTPQKGENKNISEKEVLELKKDISQLREKLNGLGEINSLAINEYKEMKEKYDFFVSQREDLEKSKKSLEELIKKVEEEIIEKFMGAYQEIKSNFKMMCKKVLNNTKGDIKLTNKDNLLDSGLELIVKFKNKKYQSLSLLSGGEKSMIAVALILAIFKYKPSPFTFFDEIEAALDEANTKKLMGMLREFTDESQFILITHNKETMREADKLYGVTMQKSLGVSKMISVDI